MNDNAISATPSAYAYPLLVKQLLLNAVAVHGEQQITYRGELRHSYRVFRERIARLASALAALGVGPGSTVAVMDWDSHRYLESYFAIPMMGATLFTVNVRLSPQQIAYTLDHAEADLVLAHADFLPVLAQIMEGAGSDRPVVVMADGAPMPQPPLPLAGEYEALVAAGAADFAFDDFDENTRAAIFYTTGTTGEPKGVSYSHRQIVLHALTTAMSLCAPRDGQRLHREDVYMPITPMFHVLAWGLPYVAVLLGLKTVLPGRYQPETLLRLRRDEKVSFSHCVPAILQMLLQASTREGELAGWKIVIGGSALPPALCAAALERGIDVFAGYGMSETGPVVALAQLGGGMPNEAGDALQVRCTAGRPVPMVDFRVVDREMRDVPHDGCTPGEIVLRAPFLTPGYRKMPEASEALWAGGYLHTQDVAVVRPDGYVRIIDRLRDVIKTGGEWVSSIELESLIGQVPGVQECAVVGVPDEKWGERPLAYVVRKSGAEVDAETIRACLLRLVEARRLTGYAVPEAGRIRFVDEIPKTSVGKIDKKLLRQRSD